MRFWLSLFIFQVFSVIFVKISRENKLAIDDATLLFIFERTKLFNYFTELFQLRLKNHRKKIFFGRLREILFKRFLRKTKAFRSADRGRNVQSQKLSRLHLAQVFRHRLWLDLPSHFDRLRNYCSSRLFCSRVQAARYVLAFAWEKSLIFVRFTGQYALICLLIFAFLAFSIFITHQFIEGIEKVNSLWKIFSAYHENRKIPAQPQPNVSLPYLRHHRGCSGASQSDREIREAGSVRSASSTSRPDGKRAWHDFFLHS